MKKKFKLNRSLGHRKALFRNLVTQLIKHEKITTTLAKAKAIKPIFDRVVTWGKKEGTRKKAETFIYEPPMIVKLFEVLAPRYRDRCGGYSRILKLQKPRRGDKADMAVIECVERRDEFRESRPARIPKVDPSSLFGLSRSYETIDVHVDDQATIARQLREDKLRRTEEKLAKRAIRRREKRQKKK